ncbi:MAG: hypothetical protein BA066_06890 [Candidatus Korarchaeota archaeon NZ13-K]|nr:MAG: hypothetical protein BA066_06890 [Candidatus Korarchaeota archaeon NZ13-K]
MGASEGELWLDRILQLMRELLRGRAISVRHFSPELEESVLWTRHSGISLSESLILTGPPALPLNERETGMRARDLMRLRDEELIRLFEVGGSQQTPLKGVILFSLAWRLLNLGVTWGLGPDQLRAIYLRLVRDYLILWGERAREAFFLFSLGMEDFFRNEEELDALSKLVLYPLAFSTLMNEYASQELIGRAPRQALSKMLTPAQDYPAKLPSPKQESMELLSMAQRINESYRELRSSIMNTLGRLVHARPGVDRRLGEVLDQLSRELSDWSLRRRFELRGAKVRAKRMRFVVLYPSAPEIWMVQQERGGMVRLDRGSEVSAVPWPFRERGIAYIVVSPSGAS